MKKIGISYLRIVLLVITVVLPASPPTSYAAAEVVAWGSNTFGQTNVPPGLSNVVAIAAGDLHCLAVTADGHVTAWGQYELGLGRSAPATVPSGLSNVVAVAPAISYDLALTADGHVVSWGAVYSGQTNIPSVPTGLSNVVAVTVGAGQNLVLTAAGLVVGWPGLASGGASAPSGLSNVVAIAGGSSHGLAVTGEGRVAAWGAGGPGTSGYGNYGQATVPSGLSSVVAIASGWYHSLALTADGQVVAWGAGSPGTSGDPNFGQATVPAGLSNVVVIAASAYHSLALTAQGRVVAWGSDFYGESDVPSGLSNAVALAAGPYFSLALTGLPSGMAAPAHIGSRFLMATAGQPFQYRIVVKNGATGYGATGLPTGLELDPGTGLITGQPAQPGKYNLLFSATNSVGSDSWTVTLSVNPPVVPGIGSNGLAQASLGLDFKFPVVAFNAPEWFGASGLPAGLAIDPQTGVISGTPLQPGDFMVSLAASNRFGVGTNSLTLRISPVLTWRRPLLGQTDLPSGLTNIVSVAAGWDRSFALTDSGQVVAWDLNGKALTNVPSGLTNVVAVAAGASHTLALTGDGRVMAWGAGSPGTSGFGNYGQATVPVGLSNVVAIAAGDYHSLALTAAGQVLAWGSNNYDPYTAAPAGQAIVPNGLSNVVAIAAGFQHSLALTADRRVVAWGANKYGQTSVPIELTNVVAIAAGAYHSLALTADGLVVAWGTTYGTYPLAGPGTPATVPSGLTNVVAIAAGASDSLALTANGQVVEWGQYSGYLPSGLSNVVAIASGGRAGFGTEIGGVGHQMVLLGLPPGVAPPVPIGPRFVTSAANQPFYFRITAKNGVATYGASGLPTGLVLDSRTGLITGEPAQAGTYDVLLSATNNAGFSSRTVTLFVNPSAVPVIESGGFKQIAWGIDFEFPVVAHNAPEWYGAIGLPKGLAIDAQTGIISGVPVELGDFGVSVTATNRYGQAKAKEFLNLRVSPLVELVGTDPAGSDIPSGLSNVIGMAAGGRFDESYQLVLTAEGRVVGWGATSVPDGLSNVVAIAAGQLHALALTAQGRVVAWGTGDGTNVPSGLSHVVAIAAGGGRNLYVGDFNPFSLALTSQGQVVGWGANESGQTTVPSGLSNVVAIAAGLRHSLALTAEGRIVAWGAGSATNVPTGLSNVVAIAAAGNGNATLTRDGRVVGWGSAVAPDGLTNIVAIAAGAAQGAIEYARFLALTAEGRVVQWGWSAFQMRPEPLYPVPDNLSNVVSIAAGGATGLALTGLPPGVAAPAWFGSRFLIGTVGRPFYYRVVVGNGADAYGADGLPAGLVLDQRTGLITGVPEQGGKFDVILSATNGLGSTRWTVSLFLNGSATAPGITSSGVAPATLGFAFKYAVQAYNSPEWYGASGLPAGLAIDPLTGLISGVPAEAGDFTVTLTASNRFGLASDVLTLEISPIVAWGTNALGQTALPRGLSNVAAIAAGGSFNLALTTEGRVIEWGPVIGIGMMPPTNLTNAVAIAAGAQHGLAATADGRVVAWGVNFQGQTSVPDGLSNVVAVAAGRYHSLALTADGRVAAWGQNIGGETQVPTDLRSVVAIAAQMEQSVALTAEGRVVAWGYNGAGQGKVISGLSNIVAIAPGVLAVTSAGQVVTWGARTGGQTNLPNGLSQIVAISSAGAYTLALTAEGRVVAWGDNTFGQTNVPAGLSNVVAVAAGDSQALALIRQRNLPSPRLQLSQSISGLQLQAQAAPGISCLLLRASQLPGPWLPAQPVTFTNSVQWLRAPDMSEPAQFFRLLRK